MIDAESVEQEILTLERRDTSYAVIERLAWLYVVRDHLQPITEKAKISVKNAQSEFVRACDGLPCELLLPILDEHFETIRAVYPAEYQQIINRIEKEKDVVN